MKHLLEMIEAVDPKDTAKLDEIDARVAVFVFNGTLEKTSFGTWKRAA